MAGPTKTDACKLRLVDDVHCTFYGTRALYRASLALMVVLASATSMAEQPKAKPKPKVKGFWCANWTREGGHEGSACAREKAKCKLAEKAFADMGVTAAPCVWQEEVWSTRIEGKPQDWLFAVEFHCEYTRAELGGSACRVVR